MNNYCVTAQKCEACKKDAMFPTSKIITDTSGTYGPILMVCSNCGYQPETDQEALERFKKNLE